MMRDGPPTPERAERWILAGLFLGLLLLYGASAPPTVALEDDGEFILAGWSLGVAHPPGFPVHTLLAFGFSQLPLGSVAWRVHLLSGALGALAVCVLYGCARRLGARPLAAATGAACLGLSEVWWSQAIVAEVYTLHVLLFGGMWLLALRLHQGDGRPATPVVLAVATGLALANHWPLTVLAGPALLPLVWSRWRALLAPRVLAAGTLAATLPYAWMMWRSQQDPLISFYGPLRSLEDLWYVISRSGYADVDHRPLAGWSDRVRFLRFVAGEATRQFTIAGAVLALAGFAALWGRGGRAVAASLAWVTIAVSLLLVAALDFEYFAQSRAAFRVYPLTGYFGAAILLACGLDALARRIGPRPRLRWAPALVAAALVAALAAVGAAANWRPHDDFGRAYALALLAETPSDAIVVADSDWAVNTLGYVHFVEGACPGCTLMHADGLLFPSRRFEPLRVPPPERARQLAGHLAGSGRPVAWTDRTPADAPVADRWLVRISGPAVHDPSIGASAAAQTFFRQRVAADHPSDATIATVQQDLRRRYLQLLATTGAPAPEALASLCQDFHGCLGLAEGAITRPDRYDPARLEALLARADGLRPDDAHRWDRARVLELRGLVLAASGRRDEAIAELKAAVRLAPDMTVAGRRALAGLGVETRLVPAP